MMQQGLTVFVPVHNEQDILERNSLRLLEYLQGLDLPAYEVLIGSNGSADDTTQIGSQLAEESPNLRFFEITRKGPGRAFGRAAALASFDTLITMDMDLSTELDFIGRAWELLQTNSVVIGSKRQGKQERSLARLSGSAAYIFAARLLLNMPYEDYSIGAKGFSVSLLRSCNGLIDGHTAYAGNVIFAARKARLPVAELPVQCKDLRPSRFNLGYEALYRFFWLLRLFVWGRMGLGRGARYFEVISNAPSQPDGGGDSK